MPTFWWTKDLHYTTGMCLWMAQGAQKVGTSGTGETAWNDRKAGNIPTPIEGEGGGGQNQPVEFHFFLLGNPGIVIHPLKWNCKVTFLNKPWALVRKYLRLAPAQVWWWQRNFWRDATPTHVLLQSDMCLAPELSASIQFSSVCQWYGMTRNVDHWEK